MKNISKPATLVLINVLVGFSYTANTVAQEETETQRRESEIQQQDRYFSPDDLRLNSEFSEYLQWPFGWSQRPEFSELTPLRQDSERLHNQYPQYLLPTQDEQRLRTVRTEERLRTEEGLDPQQRDTDQGQAFGEGIVLRTEQRQQTREVAIEPRQTRVELATDNADSGTEYFQQEQTEQFVTPLENSSLVEGGQRVFESTEQIQQPLQLDPQVTEQRIETIVQQENVRQIEVVEGRQIDGQRVIEGHQFIEGQRFVEGQPQIEDQPQIQGQRIIESPQVVKGQLPVQSQRVFESTEQIQQPLQLDPQVTEQRVETIVQQENVRQIEVVEGRQIDGQRAIEGHQFIEGQRFVEGQPQIQGQRIVESPQVVKGQLPVQGQHVFESTEQIQLEPQVTEQRVETRVRPGTQETRGEGIVVHANRREIETLETENLVGVPPISTPNRFEKEEGQAVAVAPLQNQRGQQAQGQAAQRSIAQVTTRSSQSESRKAGAWWILLPLFLVPFLCWAAWRFISSLETEEQVTKTRSTTDQSTTRTLATSKTSKSQQRQSREFVEREVSDRQQTTRSEVDQTERKSRDRSEQTVRSETRTERPECEEQTTRSETDRTERKSRDRSERTVRSESSSERPEREEQTTRSETDRTERKSSDRSERTVRSESRSESPEREEQTIRSETDRTERKSSDRSEQTVRSGSRSERPATSSRQQRELSREVEAEATDCELNAQQQERQGAEQQEQGRTRSPQLCDDNTGTTCGDTRSQTSGICESKNSQESKNGQARGSNCDDRNSSAGETNRETVASTAESRDDLTRIEGITEEAQRALYSSGYYRYSDLQNASKKQLKRVLAGYNLKFTDAQTKSWIVQSESLVSQGEISEQSVQQSQFNTSDSDTRASEEHVSRNASSQRDDLTKIRGIGKATSDLLSRSGITSYRDLYEAEPQRLRQLLDQAGPKFKLIDPSNWSQQAALAMNANSDGLKRWQPESAGASSTQCNHDYSSMEPDDLTAIRGIGPATQKILLEKGIHRFEQIASMKSEQFEELFAEYQDKFNLVDPSTWPEQAQSMLGNRISANEQEIEIMNEIQSIAQIAKEQPRETRQSDRTPQS